ncbi:MAG: N-6 DNA methylase [Nitrospiraceae bacterium]|nr:N-6 DNA methylase [Nitrospiraceae bacterium]
MGLPKDIADLIERFDRNRESYKSGQYNEMQLRQEFLDPLFAALGWDMNNQQGYAEAYKEVIHEDSIKIGSDTKAPDYCFRIGGTRKFFLEAKKPSVYIKEDISPAFQLRRYAWSAKLPLSILSDFEEFAIYDTRIKPEKTDKASSARIHYFTYKEYEKQWDLIVSVFSRDAVLKGSFDKYAEKSRLKKGTATVDDAFLTEIEDWRAMLAKNIALRNADLTTRELNFAVQRTIDRIVFLRICEDRGIEEYGRLQTQLNGTNVYKRLVQLFSQADDRYNSGLFHFQREKERHEEPDKLTLNISIDDKPLKDIINRLYYPESPYEFSVLSADILGQVYEQFLGKVIRLTAGHQAKVEEKPEVRKAGGVYYTPKYIVDYIVKNTVGKLLEGQGSGGKGQGVTPKEAAKLKILDPACGSGSFLLGAYQYLLDWHLKWYVDNEPEKLTKIKQPTIYQGPSRDPRTPNWHLTTSEKKRILLNNIYGVDIDSQAVEVTKLSLLLKVLEGENNQTLANQLRMFHERALPDLGDNIKCGNSLIGPDFYQQQTMLDDEERYRVNVFDWEKEFPLIFPPRPQGEGRGEGGFDAVIGNPPYIFTREQLSGEERQYFATRYQLSWEKHNTFMLFMERLLWLLGKNGKGGFIVPNSWLTIESAKLLREAYVPRLELLADLNYLVFHRVSMEPCIFTVTGHDLQNKVMTLRVNAEDGLVAAKPVSYDRKKWSEANHRIVFSHNTGASAIVDKILRNSTSIGEFFDVRTGLQAYEEGKGTPPQSAADVKDHVFDRERRVDENSVKYLQGRDVGRYELDWSGMWMQYGPWLSQPREIDIFKRPRILLREITSDYPYCLNAMFVAGAYLNNKSILNVLHCEDDEAELKKL